jgi:curli biogenesis system outer membrane secretion channel CsgG
MAVVAATLAIASTQSSQAEGNKEATPIAAAVVRFRDGTEGSKGTAEKVTELLANRLSGSPELLLVEREDLDNILKEHELNLSGAVAAEEAIRIGRITGAKLLISGSVIDTGNERYLVAKIISTETTRVLGASTKGKVGDSVGEMVDKLSEEIMSKVREKATTILPSIESRDDRLNRLKKSFDDRPRPTVVIKVTESHSGLPKSDPAAQTEFTLWCNELGFKVIDPATGNESDADFVVTGEGLSEFASRRGNLVSVRARLEVKVVNRKSGEVLAVDRQMVRVTDSTEVIAGKEALQQAAATLAERVLPKVASAETPKKKKK